MTIPEQIAQAIEPSEEKKRQDWEEKEAAREAHEKAYLERESGKVWKQERVID